MRNIMLAAAAAGLVFGLAGCGGSGDRPIAYKQGHYQGKADTPPWSGAAFNGDQKAWTQAINNRLQGQNEYVRINHN